MRADRGFYEKVKNVAWAGFFAMALWFVMVQSEKEPRTFTTVFRVHGPPNLNIGYEPNNEPPRAEVTVRGSPAALARVQEPIHAYYELPKDAPLGEMSIPMREFHFDVQGVDVEKSGLAGLVQVELARVREDDLAIEIVADRQLPEGWKVEELALDQHWLRARGPEDVMLRRPKLVTREVVLREILDRIGFDPKTLLPRSFDFPIEVGPPNPSIQILPHHGVKLRLKVRPVETQADIELTPAVYFRGPGFEGFPFRLTPLIHGQDKIKLLVSGPETELKGPQLDATRAKFICFVEVTPEHVADARTGKIDRLTLEAKVIPPPGIAVERYVTPTDRQIRLKIDPLETKK